jgi:uncharacterized membrane protein
MTSGLVPGTSAVEAPSSARTRKKSTGYLVWLGFAGFVSCAVAVFSVSAYVTLDIGQSRTPVRGMLDYGLLVMHVATAVVALAVGVLQFVPSLQTPRRPVHRWVGRLYFACVIPGSIFALPVALMSLQGLAVSVPLSVLSVLWFITGVQGLRTALRRDFRMHRIWMIRSFALTAAGITGRLYVVIMLGIIPDSYGATDHDISAAANWLSFVGNLLIAEWWIQRGNALGRPRNAGQRRPVQGSAK